MMTPEIERQAEPADGWRAGLIGTVFGVLVVPVLMYAIVAFESDNSGPCNPGPFLAYYFEVWRELWWLLLLCGVLSALLDARGRARRRR